MRRYLAALAAAAILFGACGGGTTVQPTPTATASAAASVQKETPDQVMARLYELAKTEGTVAIYSSMNTDDAKKVFPVFEQKFAGVKVQHTRASGEDPALRKILGDTEAQNVIKCIAANKPSLRSGHTEMANLLAAGEFATTLSSNGHRLAQLKYESKQPIDWARTDPIITDVQAMALADKAPHPNAGRLLMEWMTSDEGQLAIQSTGRVPANPKVAPKYPDLTNFAKIFYISMAMRADFDMDAAFWRTTLGIK